MIGPDGKLYMSSSMLADMAACSTKAWLRYYRKVTAAAQSSPAAAGVAVHAGLEAYWRTSSIDDGLTAFDDVYRAHADEFVPDDDRLSFNNVRRTLEVYFKRNPVETLPFRIRRDLVELPFSAPLSDNVVLVGQPDAIVETYDTGNLYILDHKAQPLTAMVLTPTGFVEMGDITLGAQVIGANGKPCNVTGVYPQGHLPAFRVRFVDGGETVCSEYHLWTVQDQFKRETTAMLKELCTPGYTRWRTPALAPVEFTPSSRLPTPPYLLGVLLGDGYFGSSIQISSADEEIVENVKPMLLGDTIKKAHPDNYSWTITGGNVLGAIKRLGIHHTRSWSKYIPPDYLCASIEDRLALLQGLLDTDGCAHAGHVSFTSVSRALVEGVVDLVRSLGGAARLRKRQGTKRQAYIVNIRLPHLTPFRLSRKVSQLQQAKRPWGLDRIIRSIKPLGVELPMQCIKVDADDGLYVTDDYIVTHNTTGNANDMWKAKFKIAPQLTAYIWAAREQLGAPVEGAFINLIELRKIPSSTRKCPEHGVHYAECGPQHSKTELLGPILRSDAQIAQWKKMATTIAERYRALILEHTDVHNCANVPTEGIFHGACGFCEFQDYCYTGKNPALESMFVPSVYNPYKGMIPTE